MTSEQGHGVDIYSDSLLNVLEDTRVLRCALDVLWFNLPLDVETESTKTAFCEIDQYLRKTVLADIRKGVPARDYYIISPISPMNPPGPEDMEKVAAAVRTLADLGLIITP
jgi:hypothetical protein